MIEEKYVVIVKPKYVGQTLVTFKDYNVAKKYLEDMRKLDFIEDVQIYYRINEDFLRG